MQLKHAIKIAIPFLLPFLIPTVSLAEQATTFIVAGSDKNEKSPFMTVSHDGGKTWNKKTLPFSSYGARIAKATCADANSKLCLAVGEEYNASYDLRSPLLYVSQDGGNTWQVPTIKDLPKGSLSNVSCTGSGKSTLCVASGDEAIKQKNGGYHYKPIILVSQDEGVSWSVKTISGAAPSSLTLSQVSCTGSTPSSTVCVINADSYAPTKAPKFIVSTDQGATWTVKSVQTLSTPEPLLYALSCSGEGTSAVCAATGEKEDGLPFFIVSSDGGQTFEEKTTKEKIPDSFLLSIKCKGNGASAFCVAGGAQESREIYDSYDLIITSHDGGQTWEKRTINNLPEHYSKWLANKIRDISCTNQSTCVATGYFTIGDGDEPYLPLIATSSDKGKTWFFKKSPYRTSETSNNVYCVDNGPACITTGGIASNSNYKLWAQISEDGGNTWVRNNSIMFPVEGDMSALVAH
jgi:Neuraminidase (sialidase)